MVLNNEILLCTLFDPKSVHILNKSETLHLNYIQILQKLCKARLQMKVYLNVQILDLNTDHKSKSFTDFVSRKHMKPFKCDRGPIFRLQI